ncbi:hypothetical protein DFQ27_002707 [Actinomortierella ambigua]|uniref:Uncharacterized protein n=1 Tax=Actinomortierella ambigua TaxID=1343610 RepID=A0A9P6Q6U6_9FUNG|nr:hypothetical protein DFQ27_002707 [Actinomortierella ambigua]
MVYFPCLSQQRNAITARKRKRAQIRREAHQHRSSTEQAAVADNSNSDNDTDRHKRQQFVNIVKAEAVMKEETKQIGTIDRSEHNHEEMTPTETSAPNNNASSGSSIPHGQAFAQASRALADAIKALNEKLEGIQLAGTRPSDIRAELASQACGALSSMSDAEQIGKPSRSASDSGDLVLSQTQHSQHTVSLWDDIRQLIHALCSKEPELESQAAESIVWLGLDNLEDGILQGLCVNELALHSNDNTNPEQAFTLPYQTICQMDSSVTKVHTELTFNILKSQPSTTLVHFLGTWLAARTNPGMAKGSANRNNNDVPALGRYLPNELQSLLVHRPSSISGMGSSGTGSTSHWTEPPRDPSTSFSVPSPLSSDIQISLLQSIISLPVLAKSPLPSRLWHQLCDDLELLWSAIQAVATRTAPVLLLKQQQQQQQQKTDESMAQRAWTKAMYLPSLDSTSSAQPPPPPMSDGIRLSNAKLPPVLVLWVMRHGPSCQDIALLERMQQFCETKMDVKGGKMVLAKIEALLRKKKSQMNQY